MRKIERCIVYLTSTGEKYRRKVSKRPFAQYLKLCATHGKSFVLGFLVDDSTTYANRERLARDRWTNVRESPPRR